MARTESKLLRKHMITSFAIIVVPLVISLCLFSMLPVPWDYIVISIGSSWFVIGFLLLIKWMGSVVIVSIRSTHDFMNSEARKWFEKEESDGILQRARAILVMKPGFRMAFFLFMGFFFPGMLIYLGYNVLLNEMVAWGKITIATICFSATGIIIAAMLPFHFAIFAINTMKNDMLNALKKQMEETIDSE